MALEDLIPYGYFLAAVGAWLFFLYLLQRSGKIEAPEGEPTKGFGFALMGPFLMWKTGKGRAFLDRLAQRRRFWRWFGDASLVVVGVAMVSMTALLLWTAVLVATIPPDRAPTPQTLLGLPGLNPYIPLWYGILALAVAIVVHEFCHGILARVSNVKLNSLGLLFFIVPVGAFVEPDEEGMKAMPRRERARLYAVGPAVNLLLALVFAFLFSTVFMGGVAPVASGVGVASVTPNSPAANASVAPGMILMVANGTPVTTVSGFRDVMAKTSAGQTVDFTFTAKGWTQVERETIVLADAYQFQTTTPKDETLRGRGFLGMSAFLISTAYFHPIGGADAFGGLPQSVLSYVFLPFRGLQPMGAPYTDFYQVEGPLAALPEPAFWVLANAFYWLFWLNVMLGATNALPAVPLDGGYIFRDGLRALVARLKKGMAVERQDRVVKNVSYAFALMILALILWQFIGPRIL